MTAAASGLNGHDQPSTQSGRCCVAVHHVAVAQDVGATDFEDLAASLGNTDDGDEVVQYVRYGDRLTLGFW